MLDVVPVTAGGSVDLDALQASLDTDVALVSVMAANGETGVLNPVSEVAALIHAAGAMFHCDATQAVGRLPFDLERIGADFVSVSGHKICGPTGVGALIVTRRSLRGLRPVMHGGGHERGLRSGSLNVGGIVGFGAAARIATDERESESSQVAALRDRLIESLKEKLSGVRDVGNVAQRLPNTANVRFDGADAEAVVASMDPVAVVDGQRLQLRFNRAIRGAAGDGHPRDAAFESVRFSVGRFTTSADIDIAVEKTVAAVDHVRALTAETARCAS